MRSTLSILAGLMLSLGAFAQDLSGFQSRFQLVKNEEGRVTAIKLKKVVSSFTIRPFLEQIKNDLKKEQAQSFLMNDAEKEAEIDALLMELGLDPYAKSGSKGQEEAEKLKESLLNIRHINVDEAFAKANKGDFWKEFEKKFQEAMLFIDPTVLANLEDARFFYKRQVTYKVIEWALNEAKKRFSEVPVLNIVSFVVVRVHDMMLEQRHFHHNMLLHYFQSVEESKLGMTKEEVDRAISSIYEYRIELLAITESNKAAANWLSFGLDKFYMELRWGSTQMRKWQGPLSGRNFKDIKRLNYGFASVMEKDARKIYHLHHSAHQFTSKPALAYDYSNPSKVKRIRSLLNLGGVALGFITMPNWLKSNVHNFLHSMYINQVRAEGALVGYFETTGDTAMMKKIYAQRANFYIVE